MAEHFFLIYLCYMKTEEQKGRPTKYKEEYVEQALNFCLLGAKDSDLARLFHIQESTLNLWKEAHPNFMEAIKDGRERADAGVAKSLYKRALGYETEEDDIRVVKGEIVVTRIRKVYPPDPTCMIFWLKNRHREYWRDRQDITATVDVSDDFKAALAKAQTAINTEKDVD